MKIVPRGRAVCAGQIQPAISACGMLSVLMRKLSYGASGATFAEVVDEHPSSANTIATQRIRTRCRWVTAGSPRVKRRSPGRAEMLSTTYKNPTPIVFEPLDISDFMDFRDVFGGGLNPSRHPLHFPPRAKLPSRRKGVSHYGIESQRRCSCGAHRLRRNFGRACERIPQADGQD